MDMQVTLTIPQTIYVRAQQVATSSNRQVEAVLSDFTVWGAEQILPVSREANDPAVEQEKEAYLRLHPHLLQTYPDQFVAIYGGELVERDTDRTQLMKRIRQKYPNEFVWISQICPEPIREIRSPSFRLYQLESV